MKLFLIFCLSLVLPLISCQTSNLNKTDVPRPLLSDSEYSNLIAQFSANDKKYSGLYNKYQVTVTLLNTKVQEAKLDKLRFFLQQSNSTYQIERNRTFQKMNLQAQVFMSFFATEKDYKNLHRPTSLWKVYIESNGQRYEGQVSKVDHLKVELKSIFPYHNRWSTGYMVTFNLPMTSLEKNKSTFTLTSSAGKSVFDFPAM